MNSESAAWRRARPRIVGVVSYAHEKARQALEAMRYVTDIFVDVVEQIARDILPLPPGREAVQALPCPPGFLSQCSPA